MGESKRLKMKKKEIILCVAAGTARHQRRLEAYVVNFDFFLGGEGEVIEYKMCFEILYNFF